MNHVRSSEVQPRYTKPMIECRDKLVVPSISTRTAARFNRIHYQSPRVKYRQLNSRT